ncbi:MAG: carboxy terminal-processing peptidase [Flavobacteriales bacterium]
MCAPHKAVLLFTFVQLASTRADAQFDRSADSLRLMNVIRALAENHYSPRALDDAFSKDVFNTYIDALDPSKLMLSEQDIASLAGQRDSIDDQLKEGSQHFVQRCEDVFGRAARRARNMHVTPRSPNAVVVNGHARATYAQRAADSSALQARWHEQFLLSRNEALLNTAKNAEWEALLPAADSAAHRHMGVLLPIMDPQSKAARFDLFLAALAGVHDAQSTYLTPEERTAFNADMTRSFVGIGITLERDGTRLRITDLEPGGPAALSGRIPLNAELVSVKSADGVDVDLFGREVADVVSLLRGPESSTTEITVRGTDGTPRTVRLVRKTIHPDSGRAQAWIVQRGPEQFGYIKLPRFYTDLSGGDGPRCSIDVRARLAELMSKKVLGLIIDLRDNQGGSMSETIEMLGLFLGAAPVAERLAKDGTVRSLRSTDGTIAYTGPLVVLVNANSASASEFFAAALQDHHRAVIIGGEHTYGKGSVQTFIELDPVRNSAGDLVPAGNLKATIALFFRPTGGTVQRTGVLPDVVLPDPLDAQAIGERSHPFALAPSGITVSSFTPYAPTAVLTAEVAERSRARVSANERFNALQRELLAIRTAPDPSFPLDPYAYRTAMMDKATPEVTQAPRDPAGALQAIAINAAMPTNDQQRAERGSTAIAEDPVICETEAILRDMILKR